MFAAITVVAHLALLLVLLGEPAVTALALGGYLAYHGWIAWGVMHPRSRLFGPNRSRLDTAERAVALTFDDGPHPVVTPQVLDILRAHGARATFFLIGKWVERHPEIARRIVAEGHGVGNHSYSHSYMHWAFPPARLAEDVGRAQQAIERACGVSCRWFRAPVGLKSCFLRRALAGQGLQLVSWSARPGREIQPGAILLLHDGHDRKPQGNPAVILALPRLLDGLEQRGYRCIPL